MQPIAQQPLGALLEHLAAKTPAPGGGAAACMVGATAAALAGMVVAYSVGKQNGTQGTPTLEDAADSFETMRARFLDLAAEDAEAYAALNAIQKRPKGDPDRLAQEPAALRRAIDAPDAARAVAMDLLALVGSLVGRTNRYLDSDLAIVAVTAEAAAVAAGWNVRINAPGLPEPDRSSYLDGVRSGDEAAAGVRARIEAACRA